MRVKARVIDRCARRFKVNDEIEIRTAISLAADLLRGTGAAAPLVAAGTCGHQRAETRRQGRTCR